MGGTLVAATAAVLACAGAAVATSSAAPATHVGWAQVSAGDGFSCAIRTDRSLWCWGDNSSGQLGLGSTTGTDSPAQVGSAQDWVDVAAGRTHACGIRSNGSLWCWGDDEAGQLGDGKTLTRLSPVQVGHAASWTQVSAGLGFTCAIDAAHTLWCWGADALDQLGIGGPGPNQLRPVRLGAATTWRSVTLGLKWGCATRTDGSAWCWGDNGGGVLGIGHQAFANRPVRLAGSADWRVLAAGDNTTCGIHGTTAGTLWCWGDNARGALGIGQPGGKRFTPAQVGTATDWTQVTTAGGSGCGIRGAGTLWCWGDDHTGQLGFRHQRPVLMPTQVGTSTSWASVSLGQLHGLGTHVRMGCWAWGDNELGELGDGTTTDRYAPVRLSGQ